MLLIIKRPVVRSLLFTAIAASQIWLSNHFKFYCNHLSILALEYLSPAAEESDTIERRGGPGMNE